MANNILYKLVENSKMAIADGVYERAIDYDLCASDCNLSFDIKNATHAAVISEIKFASPSEGKLRAISDPVSIATQMIRGGAKGLSVLTQPHLFGGSPEYFAKVRQAVDVPMLMKDIIIDKQQIDAASCIGADYILLVQSVFESGLLGDVCMSKSSNDTIRNDTIHNGTDESSYTRTLYDFINYAHKKRLGVLLEVHTIQEYANALYTDADIIGINNRNLDTLDIDVGVTCNILSKYNDSHSHDDYKNSHHQQQHNINNHDNDHNNNENTDRRIVISESGISSPHTIRKLHDCGADGFLIGSSIMKSDNIQMAVSEMVSSY